MVEGMPAEEIQSLLLVKILGMKPGWKETMFQVHTHMHVCCNMDT